MDKHRRVSSVLAAGALVALGVLVLGGCVGTAPSNGTATPAGSASEPVAGDTAGLCGGEPVVCLQPETGASPSGSPSPGATAQGQVITGSDGGATVHLAVGQRFTLELGTAQDWTVDVADGQVIRLIAGAPLPVGAQGIYEAVAAGTTALNASGKAHCTAGQVCPLYVIDFSVTIVVD
jgi:hypothetical protein